MDVLGPKVEISIPSAIGPNAGGILFRIYYIAGGCILLVLYYN
jgi:hypothetical protein